MGIKVRESNFELLRIIAMLMIVIHHFCFHGVYEQGWNTNVTLLNHVNNLFLQILNLGGKIGVNLFILITGYFFINKSVEIKGFFKIFFMTVLYSLIILLASYIYGEHVIPKQILKNAFNPLDSENYWFVANYLVLYLFIPFYNKLLNSLNLKDYLIFILLGILLWSFLGIFYSPLAWFFLIYAVGGFVNKFELSRLNFKNSLWVALLSFLTFIVFFVLRLFDDPIKIKNFDMNNFMIFVISIAIFCIFKNAKIPYNKSINYISSSVFAVYLIHDNNIVRNFLWESLIKVTDYIIEPYFIAISFLIPIIIFISCVLFDKLFCKFYMPIINFIIRRIEAIKTLIGLFLQRKLRQD